MGNGEGKGPGKGSGGRIRGRRRERERGEEGGGAREERAKMDEFLFVYERGGGRLFMGRER